MSKPKLYVLLERVRSAYNVGSVFRTCDSAGVDGLYLTGYTPYPPHNKLDKTALGSLNHVTWQRADSAEEIIKALKKKKIKIWVMETLDTASSIYQSTFTEDTCLVFGNEVDGVSQEVIDLADAVVKIPQFGIKESLNIATAVGVAVYELVRQRQLL